MGNITTKTVLSLTNLKYTMNGLNEVLMFELFGGIIEVSQVTILNSIIDSI